MVLTEVLSNIINILTKERRKQNSGNLENRVRESPTTGTNARSGKADELQMSGVRKELGVARNSTKERLMLNRNQSSTSL